MFDPHDLDPVTAAYHEAGHVMMARLLGGQVVLASIEGEHDDRHAGRTVVRWHGLAERERVRRSAMVALAGPVAENHWRGGTPWVEALDAWQADWIEVEAALKAEADADDALRRWLREVALELTDDAAWAHLCCIADALEAHGTLDEALLAELQ